MLALGFAGCKDDSLEVGPPSVEKPVVTLELGEPSATGVTMMVTPSDDGFRYYCDILACEILDEYHDSSPAVYLENLFAELAGKDDWKELSRAEVVERITDTGYLEYTSSRLEPHTEYVAFAMALDERGRIISDVAVQKFWTRRVVLSDLSFECEVLDRQIDNIDFSIIPSNDEEDYFVGIRTAAYCDRFVDNDRLLDDIVETEGVYLCFALSQGTFTATSEDIVPFTYYTPDTGYELVVFGFSAAQMQPTTELFRFPIRTLKSELAPEACDFEAKVSDVKVTSASVRITPSDLYATYAWGVIDAAAMEQAKSNFDDYLARYISEQGGVENIEEWRVYGSAWNSWMEELESGTQYYVWAVCVDEFGAPTAPVRFFAPFTTTEAVVSELASVSITLDNYFDGDEVVAAYPDAPFSAGVAGKAYISISFAAQGEVSKWFGGLFEEDLSDTEELSDREVIDVMVNNDKVSYLFPTTSLYTQSWNKPHTAMAFAQDKQGNYTKVLRKVFTFTKEGAAPMSQFVVPEN